MTTCPYKFAGAHDAIPDPQALALTVGEVRTCQRCRLPWRVIAVAPYELEPELVAARAMLMQRASELRAMRAELGQIEEGSVDLAVIEVADEVTESATAAALAAEQGAGAADQ